MSGSDLLRVEGLSSAWGATPVLRNVTFRVTEGEFLALMGPNGSGKTTLLRLIAGLDRAVSGSIRLRGASLDGVPAHRRGIGLLFQDPDLFPNRSVWENVAYGPQVQKMSSRAVEARVEEMLELLRLRPLADRRPDQLSGGERQRAALARTLAPQPALVLLDEPFASVDAEIRLELRAEFRKVLAQRRTAAILVTHDREEALFLGDRVAVLLEGELRQTGSAEGLHRHPADEEVARFLGYNVIELDGAWHAVDPFDLEVADGGTGGIEVEVVASGWSHRGRSVLVRAPGGAVWQMFTASDAPPTEVGSSLRIRWQRAVRLGTRGVLDQSHME
ncbi:MAG: ABC transporter ATP-binding protein [Thermoplasmata archaeon]|nr:ABC transporter ATP-binding protein [Thermoplasmata archaeon]